MKIKTTAFRNNYPAAILLLIILISSFSGSAQTLDGKFYQPIVPPYSWQSGWFKLNLNIPKSAATTGRDTGAIYYKLSDSSMYVWTGSQWRQIGSGSGGSQTLQQTTTLGNKTTDGIELVNSGLILRKSLLSYDSSVSYGPTSNWKGFSFDIARMSNSFRFRFDTTTGTTARDYFFPDTTGVIPMAVKINGTRYAPGPTGLIDLGTISGGGALSDGDYGDITVSGTGTVMTINNGEVVNTMLADMPAHTFKGNNTGVSDVPLNLTIAEMQAELKLPPDSSVSISNRILSNFTSITSLNDSTLTFNRGNGTKDTLQINLGATASFPTDTSVSISNRLNLKLNISDTSSMLTNYVRAQRLIDTAAAIRSAIVGGSYLPLSGGTLTGDLFVPKMIGGTGTTSTMTFQSTSGNATTGADFIWKGGNNGAAELMRLKASNQLALGSNGLNINGGGTQNTITAGINAGTEFTAGTTYAFYSYNTSSYFVQFANGTSTANYIQKNLTVGGTGIANSTLQTNSFATAYTATATGITLDITHNTVNVTATGQTITLPTAVSITGREYTIKLTASGTGTVATTSSQTIDGSTTYSLSAQYKYVTVKSDGANWIVIGNN